MVLQLELFGALELVDTPATADGHGDLVQCSWCGTLVLCPGNRRVTGVCPSCSSPAATWWRQQLPIGPFRHRVA